MPTEEQDACNICDGDRSTTKNPIIFCDGKGCNMPVHKLCYNVREIPEDDWYCQRCENKKRKKATIIICCPMQTGAVKKTTVTGEYMHVVCAMWNQSVNKEIEPYVVNKSLLEDKEQCYYCNQKKGLTIGCEEPNCNIRFHATCGINNSLITPASSVPADFIPKCSKHQTIYYTKKSSTSSSKGKRRLRRNDSDGESDEDSEEDEDESDQESEDEEVEEEDDDDEVSEEGRRKEKRKKPLMIGGNSNKGKSPATPSPITPMKRRASPQSLFSEDQQSSDDDDDMGTSSASKPKLNTFNNKSNGNLAISIQSATVPPSASTQASYRERLEAKRKKSAIESRPQQQEDVKQPLTITPPPSLSSSSSAASVTPKQKLPNRAHLTNSSNGTVGNGTRPGDNTPPTSIKRYNGPGTIKDIDEIYNEAKSQQRWSNNNNTALHHPQPTTPHAVSTTSFFESEIARNSANSTVGQRKSMDGWKPMNGGEKEELLKLREENQKLLEFKRAVSEVLSALNVPVPAGIQPELDHVESYVAQLQSILRRAGFSDQDRVQIRECTKNLNTNNQ